MKNRISTTALFFLLVILAACGKQPSNTITTENMNQSLVQEDNQNEPEIQVESEPYYCTFSNVDELRLAVQRTKSDSASDSDPYFEELKNISSFYMIDLSCLQDYRLFQIEVLPSFIISYYVPKEDKGVYYDNQYGIMVTSSRYDEFSLADLSKQVGISINEDGVLYDEVRGDLSLTQDGKLIIIHVPKSMNKYDTIRAICQLDEITVD